MQPVICYVYEYDGDRRIRNAGFLKIQPKNHGVLLYFHIRSPLFRAQSPWSIYAFRSDGSSCTLYPLLNVSVENQSFRMQLSLDSLRLTDQLTLDDMDGFWMCNPQNLMLAAAWKPTFVDSTRFSVYEDAGKLPDSADGEPADEPQNDPEDKTAEEPSNESRSETSEESFAETPEKTTEEAPEGQTGGKAIEAAELPQMQTTTSKNIRKICRKDLTLLPRRDWSLSNNSFLLHGCHNYHHLLLIEEEQQLFLGVPGVYDQREARAAELFGFPLFSSEYVPLLDLTPEEKSETPSFGHYLRKIRRN